MKRPNSPWLRPIRTDLLDSDLSSPCRKGHQWIHPQLLRRLRVFCTKVEWEIWVRDSKCGGRRHDFHFRFGHQRPLDASFGHILTRASAILFVMAVISSREIRSVEMRFGEVRCVIRTLLFRPLRRRPVLRSDYRTIRYSWHERGINILGESTRAMRYCRA